jgi:hypothetical protein
MRARIHKLFERELVSVIPEDVSDTLSGIILVEKALELPSGSVALAASFL